MGTIPTDGSLMMFLYVVGKVEIRFLRARSSPIQESARVAGAGGVGGSRRGERQEKPFAMGIDPARWAVMGRAHGNVVAARRSKWLRIRSGEVDRLPS